MNDYTPADEAQDDREIAEELVRAGWQCMSNKYRIIARLPEGATGLEVLRERSPLKFREIMEHTELRAADVYRRMYAPSEGNTQTLDFDMFEAFKRARKSSW